MFVISLSLSPLPREDRSRSLWEDLWWSLRGGQAFSLSPYMDGVIVSAGGSIGSDRPLGEEREAEER